jgi:HPt (histidine-containing phosphotransfer) domain-containing protein
MNNPLDEPFVRGLADGIVPARELVAYGLLELFDGDRAAVLEMLDAALPSIETDALRIRRSVDTNDGASVIEAAHHLRGTCGELRAARLRDIAALIERAPKEATWRVDPPLLAELQSEVDALRLDLERTRAEMLPGAPFGDRYTRR